MSRFEWNRVVSSESWLRRSEFVPVVGLNINSHVNCAVFAKKYRFVSSIVQPMHHISEILARKLRIRRFICGQLWAPTELRDPFHCRIAVCPWRFDCHNLPEVLKWRRVGKPLVMGESREKNSATDRHVCTAIQTKTLLFRLRFGALFGLL